jgi:hypothetical protein
MKTTSTSTSASSLQRPDAAARARPSDDPAFQRRADDFSRLLREKSAQADPADPSERECSGSDAVPVATPQPLHDHGWPAAPTPAAAATPLPGACPAAPAAGAVVNAPAGTPAPASMPSTHAVDAAAAIQARMDLTEPVDPAAARRFDVSIRGPACSCRCAWCSRAPPRVGAGHCRSRRPI